MLYQIHQTGFLNQIYIISIQLLKLHIPPGNLYYCLIWLSMMHESNLRQRLWNTDKNNGKQIILYPNIMSEPDILATIDVNLSFCDQQYFLLSWREHNPGEASCWKKEEVYCSSSS